MALGRVRLHKNYHKGDPKIQCKFCCCNKVYNTGAFFWGGRGGHCVNVIKKLIYVSLRDAFHEGKVLAATEQLVQGGRVVCPGLVH